MSRILTKGNEEMAQEIKQAVLDGYNVMVLPKVKDGMVYAKIIKYKYADGALAPIGREDDLRGVKR